MLVFDSSTLILLAKAEALELFVRYFQNQIYIPKMVETETCIKGREETPLIKRLIDEKRIKVLKVKNKRLVDSLIADFNLDIGEAEAIILTEQEKLSIVATDDRNAMKACKILHLNFVTAMGIVIRMYEKKLISKDDINFKIEKLISFGRYSKKIVNDVLEQLRGGNQNVNKNS